MRYFNMQNSGMNLASLITVRPTSTALTLGIKWCICDLNSHINMHKCIGEVCEGKVENVTPMAEFKSTGKAVALVI